MTATGPDMGTPEYKEAMEHGTIGKYIKARYKIFEREKEAPPWAIQSEEIKKEINRIFKDPKGPETERGLKSVVYLYNFFQVTGGIPASKETRIKLLKLLHPLLTADAGQDVAIRLSHFMHNSQERNLLERYRNGSITPELVAILNDKYEWTDELYKQHFLPERSFLLPYLLEEKKLDFTPFRGPDDAGDEWYFDYKIGFSPLPVTASGFGPAITLEQIINRAEPDHIKLFTSLKDAVKRALQGVKPTEKWLKEQMKLQGEELEKALQGYLVKPVPAETILQFAEAVELQHQQREQEQTSRDVVAPFTSPYDTGFYVNPVTCKINDLRPYWQELHGLLSVISWQYLKDYAAAIREAVAELNEPPQDEVSPLQSLFPDTFFPLPAEKRDFRNMPVSKPVRRQIRAYATANISGQSINLMGRHGEVLQTVAFADATGKPSEQVITPFDISIQNCVGSLQQKNAGKVFFTDIEIAKEFNSTPDKQGHITPDSPIVQAVRQSMKRLSSVYGRIDVTEQIAQELARRHPNKSKVARLQKGKERLAVMQPLVKIDKIGVHTLKNDRDTLCYCITESPPFYLHGALTRQMIQIPFEQLNSRKNLTTEIRLLREYTRINIEAAISMQKEGLKADTIRFNKILDDTFRTSADPAESVERLEITQVVQRIPERKRYRLQSQILNYLDELKGHKIIKDYTVIKKKVPGKAKAIEYGFTIETFKEADE